MKQPLSIFVCLTVLSACATQHSDYQRPALPTPTQWSSDSTLNDKDAISARTLSWQQYFTDPKLQELIQLALEHNRDLKIATQRIIEARANYRIQADGLSPTVSLNGSLNRSHTPASVSQNGMDMDTQRYDLGLGIISYEVDFWGRIGLMGEIARAEYLASHAAQQAFHNSLIANIANNYYNHLSLQERLVLAQNTLNSLKDTEKLTQLRFQVGDIRETNLLNTQSAVLQQQASISQLENQLQASQNLLSALIGSEVKLDNNSLLSQQTMPPTLIAELPDKVLLERPDVIAAEQKLIAAHGNIDAIRLAFWPKITLTSSIGLASSALSALFSAGTTAWAFQPLISMPLFTGERKANSIEIADARKNIAIAEYEKTIQQAFRETSDLLSTREKLGQQLDLQQQTTKLSQEQLDKVQKLFTYGQVSLLELQDAQRQLYNTQQTLLATQQNYLNSSAQLYLALAGAYQATTN